jgi:hypothetical protein
MSIRRPGEAARRSLHEEGDLAQLRRFAVDSPLEGDGFEPSVPRQVFLAAPSIPAQFTFRNINRLARNRDRWFESISLQRGVSNEPSRRQVSGIARPKTVGGSIAIAAITKHEGFQ